MKPVRIVIGLLLASASILLSGCSKNHAESIADQQLNKLQFTWNSSSVTLDDVSMPAYSNFKITFEGSQGSKIFNYTTEGRPKLSPWPATGTFTFDDTSPTTSLKRDDGVVVTYEVVGTSLTMKFNYSTPGYLGRANAVKGKWVFEFTH